MSMKKNLFSIMSLFVLSCASLYGMQKQKNVTNSAGFVLSENACVSAEDKSLYVYIKDSKSNLFQVKVERAFGKKVDKKKDYALTGLYIVLHGKQEYVYVTKQYSKDNRDVFQSAINNNWIIFSDTNEMDNIKNSNNNNSNNNQPSKKQNKFGKKPSYVTIAKRVGLATLFVAAILTLYKLAKRA